MINGVAILFGLVAMITIIIAGGWMILFLVHIFLRKYHQIEDHMCARKIEKNKS